ncbi:MAG: hypothetical protein OEV30_03140 [Ignavibacteria bacterium]|nr:hypothetical protein [Ignavibacteria bacterium]
MTNLTYENLRQLIDAVFKPGADERNISLFTDVPSVPESDNPGWRDRRAIIAEWYELLKTHGADLPFQAIRFYEYPDVGSNNNDLPEEVSHVDDSGSDESLSLVSVLEGSSVVIAMTEYSATAPLKVLGRQIGFRGATMPGFSRRMIPALGLDYEKVNERVVKVKRLMDQSDSITVRFDAEGEEFRVRFDTRYRNGHASGGLMREPGIVGNLPSGEAYIVPYEGEKEGEKSGTKGILPVRFGDEIVLYDISENRARSILSKGAKSAAEASLIAAEPAYGNIAEVGIGVLGQWGVEAVGSTLLDEKLGLHVAFGRSEHFGGITGPSSFRDPRKVVHIDRVYVPSVQPGITPLEVTFWSEGKGTLVMENGALVA